jgi:hypothetical protein
MASSLMSHTILMSQWLVLRLDYVLSIVGISQQNRSVTMATSRDSYEDDDEQKKNSKDTTALDWSAGPPPPPDRASVVADLSCQGTLAMTLRDALLEFQEEGESSQSIDVDRVMQAFGESVAQCQQEQYLLEAVTRTSNSEDVAKLAPAALLRGRVHHYNRFGSKWRIVVEDVEIHPRKPLDPQRRKRERPSLWSLIPEDDAAPVLQLPRLEILLYNDIE